MPHSSTLDDGPAEVAEQPTNSADRTRRSVSLHWLGSEAALVVLSLFAGLVAWEVVARTMNLEFLPPASDVSARLWEMIGEGTVLTELRGSLTNLLVGYVVAVAFGVSIGLLMGRFRWLEQALDPYVYALLTAPTIVFVPVYFAIFGLSNWGIICLIVQYAVFIIVVNTVTAVKTVDTELVEMARVYGAASEWKLVTKVVFRAALPLTAAGIRLGLGRAIKGMINGEILIAITGLGGMSSAFGRAYDAEGVLAVLILVIAVALVLDRIALMVDRRVNSWVSEDYS